MVEMTNKERLTLAQVYGLLEDVIYEKRKAHATLMELDSPNEWHYVLERMEIKELEALKEDFRKIVWAEN